MLDKLKEIQDFIIEQAEHGGGGEEWVLELFNSWIDALNILIEERLCPSCGNEREEECC